jgi:hypothetical protein
MGWKSAKFLSGKTERPVTEPEKGVKRKIKDAESKKVTQCCECGFLWAFYNTDQPYSE